MSSLILSPNSGRLRRSRFEPKEPTVKFLVPGRLVRVERPLRFIDSVGQQWRVPAGFESDGASIPRVFWPLFGSPFGREYRIAALVHDYYCEKRIALSSRTHRVFFEGCVASGLPKRDSWLAYWAVRSFGPYWGEEAHWSDLRSRALLLAALGPNGKPKGGTGAFQFGNAVEKAVLMGMKRHIRHLSPKARRQLRDELRRNVRER